MDKKLNYQWAGVIVLITLFVSSGHSVGHSTEPELISVSAEGKKVIRSSRSPHISEDGRYVVFESDARLTADDQNRTSDVYLFDRSKKKLERIPGLDPSRDRGGPHVSRDGRLVAFHAIKKENPARNISRVSDILVYDRREKKVRRVTMGWDGKPHDGEALYPRLIGRHGSILYTSNGRNLLKSKVRPLRQVYLYDGRKKKTVLLSRNKEGDVSNRSCGDPNLSNDGLMLVFRSVGTNLVPGITRDSLSMHLYFLHRKTNQLFQIDDFQKGFNRNAYFAGSFDMDSSGKIIIFEGRKRDQNDPKAALTSVNLFTHDVSKENVELLTTGMFLNHSKSPSLSGDGRYLAFVYTPETQDDEEKEGLVVYDREKDRWARAATGRCANPQISKNGSTIVYEQIEDIKSNKKKKMRRIYTVTNPFLDN